MKETEARDELVLREVAILVAELDPARAAGPAPTLDSRLGRDLRLDSLGRAELLLRLGRRFGVELPERLLVEAETPRDLLAALSDADDAPAPRHDAPALGPASHPERSVVETPERARNLLEVVEFHAQRHPERVWIELYGDEGTIRPLTYGEISREAEEVAAGLGELEGMPGAAALMLPTGREYFQAFWGILRAGGIPVPLYPPVRPSQLEDHLRRQAAILRNAQTSVLITVPEARPLARILRGLCPELRAVVTVAEIRREGARAATPTIRGEDIAFLQYTSGSTGLPKGVVLTHDNLLANLRAMGPAAEITPRDVFVSWLPLYHDMGLIGACLGSLYHAFGLVLLSPLAFLSRPARWLQTLHRHRGTLSAAPNFAYELCLKKIEPEELEGIDLSCWRLALNGAEPVRASTLRRFGERFAPWGFRSEAFFPAYGLAECAVGLAFPRPGTGFRVDRIDRKTFQEEGRSAPAGSDDGAAVELVCCGRPIPEHEIRIVDDASRELPERHVGRIQFRGPSATRGYFRHPEATRELFDGDWLESRDLGYLAEGELFLTGRAKDIIIRAGRNLLPYELEEAVGALEGVRKGCVAVFGAPDPTTGTERVIVLAETRLADRTARATLREAIADRSVEVLGAAADEIVLAALGTVLKTSSGKIRRPALRDRYERGELGRRPRGAGWQVVRLAASGLGATLRRGLRRIRETLWGLWAWGLFGGALLWLWPAMLVVPGRHRRRALARGTARAIVRLAGLSLRVRGLEKLPRGPCLVVANHASYADAPLLLAALPSDLTWVAKEELGTRGWTRLPLERIGVRFVERFDAARGVEDSRRLAELARSGETLVIFPEGTFDARSGLLPFRLGAFRIATEAGLPVVPVALLGTRSLLRAGRRLPRPAAIEVRIGEPLEPTGKDFAASIALREAARRHLLSAVDEPDLSGADLGAFVP